jgi:3-oxoacyl-[acyl-carrier-protein] synthase-3
MQYKAFISGVHGFLPDYVLNNAELEKMVRTSDEWIVSRTGIRERRILKNKDQGTSFMGIQAVKSLLLDSNLDPAEIDLIICATITPDYPTPASANIIAHYVEASNAFSYDINAACSGFLFSLVTASQYIETNKCSNVIVVGSDKMSSIVDYKDRNTCILFGDGAGAVLLQRSKTTSGIIDSILKSDGSGTYELLQKAGGSLHPATIETVEARQHFIYQNGRSVFKTAISKMVEAISEIMQRNNLSIEDISWVVPHQANIRIISGVAESLEIPQEKVLLNIEKTGNTTAATIPLCLWAHKDKIRRGDKVIVVTFGGGFTWGAAYIIW